MPYMYTTCFIAHILFILINRCWNSDDDSIFLLHMVYCCSADVDILLHSQLILCTRTMDNMWWLVEHTIL